MFNKTLFAVGITVLLFVGYLFAQYYIFEKFEVPGPAVPVVQQVSEEEERVVSPGGPGTPNQMPAPRVLASE